MRFTAGHFLAECGNGKQLGRFEFYRLKQRVRICPDARALSETELICFVMMVVAGCRQRLYREGASEAERIDLSRYPTKVWPLLLIFDAPRTQELIHCLNQLLERLPTRTRGPAIVPCRERETRQDRPTRTAIMDYGESPSS